MKAVLKNGMINDTKFTKFRESEMEEMEVTMTVTVTEGDETFTGAEGKAGNIESEGGQ